MAFLYKNYCFSLPESVEDAILSDITFGNDQVTAVDHVLDQEFDITTTSGSITYIAPDCWPADNQWPPIVPVDIDFVGLLFVAGAGLLGAAWAIRAVQGVFR